MSWQDPIALALCALLLIGAFVLRRRLSRSPCTSCGTSRGHEPARPVQVRVESLRLGRRR